MHIRSLSYRKKTHFEMRYEDLDFLQDFCRQWYKEGDPLHALWNDYLNDIPEDNNPDPVTAKKFLNYVKNMMKKYDGLHTFERERERFERVVEITEFVAKQELMIKKMIEAARLGKEVYGESWFGRTQHKFAEITCRDDI